MLVSVAPGLTPTVAITTLLAMGTRLEKGTTVLDRYTITGFLGAGAFADVYAATQLNIDRPVAIKVLHMIGRKPGEREAFIQRFLQEAEAAARINHPNVVTIHDVGYLGELPVIVMEYLDGHDLETEIRKSGPIEPNRAIDLMLGALEALARAHELGIVHKDLKPSNLYLCHPNTPREILKVVDYGVARMGGLDEKLTSTGQLFGTPQYLAPEYIEHQTVTPALDVYQCGLILVEMLTGEMVVNESGAYRCLIVHTTGALHLPEHVLPGAFGDAIRRALATKRDERFANADEFRQALLATRADVESFARLTAAPTAAITEGLSADTLATAETRGLATADSETVGTGPEGTPATADNSRRRPVTIAVVAVLLLLAVVAGGAVAATQTGLFPFSPPTQAPAPTPSKATTTETTGQLVDQPPTEELVEEANNEVDAEQPAAPTVEVVVETVPEGATVVTTDDQVLGKSPIVLTFGPDDPPTRTILAVLGRRKSQKVTVAPDGPDVVKLTVEPPPGARQPPPTKKYPIKRATPPAAANEPAETEDKTGMGFMDGDKDNDDKPDRKIGFVD